MVFLKDGNWCPFTEVQKILESLPKRINSIFVDFHAEATAEKRALAFSFDGQISAFVGTHTHIQTADEEILPNNTAYITDVGMTGPHDSCIGIKKEIVISKMKTSMHLPFQPAEGGLQINAVVISIDETTGKALTIQRIRRKY